MSALILVISDISWSRELAGVLIGIACLSLSALKCQLDVDVKDFGAKFETVCACVSFQMGKKVFEEEKVFSLSPRREWTMDCYDQLRICLFSSDAERESPSPSPPTTPEHLGQAPKRRRRFLPSETIMPCTPAPPRSALRSFTRTPANAISESAGRYHQEFEEIEHIGSGAFGAVYKCRNRVDNGVYAVKKSKCPVQDLSEINPALREARTHHQLSAHPHVVR